MTTHIVCIFSNFHVAKSMETSENLYDGTPAIANKHYNVHIMYQPSNKQ